MFGLLERLDLWLHRAAVGELDPADAPLHPPVAYPSGSAPRLVIRTNAPELADVAWIGLAHIRRISAGRLDVIGWTDELSGDSHDVAPAVLLPTPMDWEYPTTVRGLLDALAARGVGWRWLLALLRLAALRRPENAGMPLIVGTPMRRLAGQDRTQHLVAWYLSDVIAQGLRLSLMALSEDERLREIGSNVEQIITDWAENASVAWCPINELRPEVTERRDSHSPMRRAFAGKTVVVWGCGAIGAHAAEWIARAGATKLILYDKARVSPGILARQPFTDHDIGEPKARVLAERLMAIDPGLGIVARVQNILTGPLAREDWHDGADIVIDATAAVAVASKLEATRRRIPTTATVLAMLLGHTAEHGICALAPPQQTGATSDVLRRAKLTSASRPGLGGLRRRALALPTTDRALPARARLLRHHLPRLRRRGRRAHRHPAGRSSRRHRNRQPERDRAPLRATDRRALQPARSQPQLATRSCPPGRPGPLRDPHLQAGPAIHERLDQPKRPRR